MAGGQAADTAAGRSATAGLPPMTAAGSVHIRYTAVSDSFLTAAVIFVSINVRFSVVEYYHSKECPAKDAAQNGGTL